MRTPGEEKPFHIDKPSEQKGEQLLLVGKKIRKVSRKSKRTENRDEKVANQPK